MYKVEEYSEEKKEQWNQFVLLSKNATFLFNRDYMDYHKERFVDSSVMIYDEENKLKAIFPASINNEFIVSSHGGLTYGGLIVDYTIKTNKSLQIFEEILFFYKKRGVVRIIYKVIPHIYHKQPAEEDLYCLFRKKFILFRRDVSSAINMKNTSVKGKKRSGANCAEKNGYKLVETTDSQLLFDIISTNLKEKYNSLPTHSYKEMNLLKSKLKKNIIMYNLLKNDKVEGGAILYLGNGVVHAQYIATTFQAKKDRGLDFIIVKLIDLFSSSYDWFDYGISTEDNGFSLNESLIKSKEEFNMSAICYDQYLLNL